MSLHSKVLFRNMYFGQNHIDKKLCFKLSKINPYFGQNPHGSFFKFYKQTISATDNFKWIENKYTGSSSVEAATLLTVRIDVPVNVGRSAFRPCACPSHTYGLTTPYPMVLIFCMNIDRNVLSELFSDIDWLTELQSWYKKQGY